MRFTESEVEEAALHWFDELGYAYAYGPELLADGTTPERDERTAFLAGRLSAALARVNRELPASAVEDALRKLTRVSAPSLIAANRALTACSSTASPSNTSAPTARSRAPWRARSTSMTRTPTTGWS